LGLQHNGDYVVKRWAQQKSTEPKSSAPHKKPNIGRQTSSKKMIVWSRLGFIRP